ncbi:hypothetical protein CH330_08760 [candidate division WOR-3 bacterium JGI_Cruoil_03_51_56]|uniref:TonB C-terminal domain-containing protein n=1 Tax=candidate division WOR-3 bacterium JGI_Cruoil_03_51_56 TaxID=1973747 RepID=A0A235BS49_UNCW3|nr:MAG: hypothetical protein CH330_08760 [candidate division WOR-3 bacterium JGI_Cruoil_03_51_56]
MKREVLISFVGHSVLIVVIGISCAFRLGRLKPKPQIFSVRLVNFGSTVRTGKPQGLSIVQRKPKSRAKPKPKSATQPVVVRKQGLGARIEGADALGYSYYLNIILSKIGDNWCNPQKGQSHTFRATVFFIIERDGTIKEVKLEKGSGNAGYDASCERALLVTDKLPPLPPEFKGVRLKLHLEFEYKP